MDIASRLRRFVRWQRISRSFAPHQRSLSAGYELFSDDRSGHGCDLVDQLPSCDLINLHWIARFVDYQSFFALVPDPMPVVWTLHDMNPFTGGCHYDQGCGRFTAGCGACPQLDSTSPTDLSAQIWQRKRKLFKQFAPGRLQIVAPSNWLAAEASRSPLFSKFSVSAIANGLDTEAFAPRDPGVAREIFGLPKGVPTVLFVADNKDVGRKGFSLLAKALNKIKDFNRLQLVSLGKGDTDESIPVPHLNLGQIDNDRLLSFVYSAADIFVLPSLQDNLPNTVLEALACGTPVAGFEVGGLPEMIRSGVTGLLAPPKDEEALAGAIVDLLENNEKRAEMSANCRRIAMEEYSLEIQTKKYIELYESLIGEG